MNLAFTKSRAKLLLFSTLTIFTVTNCTNNTKKPKSNSGVVAVDINKIKKSNLPPKEKAEQLALAGEKLLTPSGFMYADTIFKQALEIDSTNIRAQFYSKFLAGPISLKGALARVRPIAVATIEGRKKYNKTLSEIKNKNLKDFLLDGEPDIKTEKDLQEFGEELAEEQDTFRDFIKSNKNIELTVNANDWLVNLTSPGYAEKCIMDQYQTDYTNTRYVLANCSDKTVSYRLNRADMEVLEQASAGLQIASVAAMAYDATGSVATIKKFEKQKDTKTKQVWEELSKIPEFAKLRKDGSELKRIISLGVDAVAGVRWAAAIQRELCPTGDSRNENNRPGFLMHKGMCVNDPLKDGSRLQDVLKTVETALAGQIIALKLVYGPKIFERQLGGQYYDYYTETTRRWYTYKEVLKTKISGEPVVPVAGEVQIERVGAENEIDTEVKPAAIILSPIADLKNLRPAFNRCDKVYSLADDTAGGLLPNHDANIILAAEVNCP